MLKRTLIIVGAAVLTGLLLVAWAWHQWTGTGPADPLAGSGTSRSIAVRIEPGMTLAAAADTLVARGLLADARVLRLGARLTGQDRAVRAGLYELRFGMSPRELLLDLTEGRSVMLKVTIPEGLDAAEIAGLMAAGLDLPAADFLLAADSLVIRAVDENTLLGGAMTTAGFDSLLEAESGRRGRRFRWCEGYLAPDTYLFAEGTTAARAAAVLVSAQLARLDSALTAPRSGSTAALSPHEILVLGSIVEAEARRADERTRIAAVYANRLAKGRRLEADPTVAFVLEKKGKRLFFRDLEVESPFNTYRNRGLPPGPIGAPGRAALEAAARPDPACDAEYFVSDGAGGHVFSRTAEEHLAAVRRFRELKARERRAQDD
jgi:UPF0755 protein